MGGTEGEIEESYLVAEMSPKKTLLFSLPLSEDNLIMSYKNVRQRCRHTGILYLLGCRQTLTIGKRKNPSARWDSLSLGRGRENRKAREKKQKEGGKRSEEEEEEEEEEDRIYDSFLCVLTRSHTRRPSALASHPPPPL